jgi:hypothetical protein
MRFFRLLLCSVLLSGAGVMAQDTEPETEANPYDPLAGVPAPLAEAIRKFGNDVNRWAYTQRFAEYNRDGSVDRTWVARFDPSQHYDVQWTLLERDGQKPTESQQKSFQKRRAKRDRERKSLGEVLLLKEATIAFQSSKEIVYEVPLQVDNTRFPPEKFQIFITVDREARSLKLIDGKLRERIGVPMVANLKNADFRLEFTVVQPEHGPVLSALTGGGVATVLLVPVGGRVEAARSDYKRVTPYDERFQVKLGPLKAIDF